MSNDPGSADDNSVQPTLRARTFNEVRYYLMVTACDACGTGPWMLNERGEPHEPGQPFTLSASCKHCGREESFTFTCDHALPAASPEADSINLTETPSLIIDVGQWLSLFYMLSESAAAQQSPRRTRQIGYRAALCLSEALKFYSADSDLPDVSALFTQRSRTAFGEHPENFDKQRLLRMQAKLPALGVMASRLAKDSARAKRRWWQFWLPKRPDRSEHA